jgi:two-component system sensor histidine kinase UhpB
MEESGFSDLRQQTDQTLREQAELLNYAHVLIRDMDGRITFWNESAQELYGWTKEEAIGQISHALLQTQFPESRATYEAQLLDQGHWEGKLTHTRRDGSRLVVASHQVLRRDSHGNPIKISEVYDDITAGERAESQREAMLEALREMQEFFILGSNMSEVVASLVEALRETQEFLTSLLENAPMPIYATSTDGQMRLVNRAWEEFDRVKRAEAIGRYLEQIYPAEVARQYRVINQRVADTAAPLVTEDTGDAPDGQHTFHTVKFPLYDATGKVEAVGGISIDITERKQAEAEVRRLNEDLERRVAERTSQLEAANQELQSEIARRAWAELQREATLEALQTSKELMERTFAGLREAVFIVDAATVQIIECNPAASEMFGYTRAEMLGQTTAFLHADGVALEEFRRQMYSAIEKRGVLFLPEFRMKRKDGTLFPTEHSVLPLEDEHGRRVALVSVVRDVTERKQAEKALRDSEVRFSTIFRSSPMPIALTRLGDGKLVDVNQAWLDLTGCAYEEVVGASPLDLNLYVNSDRRSQLMDELRAQGKVDRYEFQLRKKSGAIADLLFSAESIELQNEPLMLSMALDITERKRAERALRESEEKFRTFVEQSLEAIMLLDEQGAFIEWNRACEEVTGLKRDEVIGRPAWDVQFRLAIPERRTPELYERLKSAGLEALRTGQAPFFQRVLEAEFCKPGGERRHMEQVLFPIKTGQGYRIGAISRDVTDRKRAEEEARRRAENLAAINDLAIQCAAAPPDTDIFALIAEKLRAITGALAVAISTYDAQSEELTVRHLAIRGRILSRLNKLLGRNAIGMRIPVSPEMLKRILVEQVTTSTDLSETTFGVVPQPIAAAAQKALDMGSFNGLALTYGDELVGTAVIVMCTGQPSLPVDVAKTFANVAAVSLRRKRADEALKESEARYRSLFEDSPTPLIEIDYSAIKASIEQLRASKAGDFLNYFRDHPEVVEGWISKIRITDLNRAALQLYKASSKEQLMNTVLDIFVDDSYQGIVQEFALAVQGEIAFDHEQEIRTLGGERRSVIARWVPVVPESARSRVLISLADITERKQASEALAESEEKFRTFIEQSSEGITLIDEQGTIIEWNRASEEITGLKREVVIGQPAWAVQSRVRIPERRAPELHERLKAATLEALGAGQASFFERVAEIEFCKSDGERRYLEQVLFPIKTGQGYRIGVVNRDVTGRKRAEAALQESEARFRVIFENAPLGIALMDMTGHPTRTNTALRKMLGYSEPELAQMTFTDFTHPDDAQADWDLFTELVAGKRDQYQIEKRYARRDGQVMWGQLSTSLIRNPDGAAQYVIGMVEDITERKQADEERERLLEQVHSLAGYLQAAQEEERTRIAREIHDEFGQALTALKMDLAWLARQLPGDHQPRLTDKIKAMADLLDATLGTVRRVAAELRPGLLDDLGLVEALQWLAQGFAERTGIECSLHLEEEEVTLGRDLDTAIFRIVQESLINVARHSGATKVRLEMEARPDCWTLTIQDNGRGITDSQLADPNSLGLMGMRERARAWGGDITFQGVPGQGTTVSVVIPKQAAGKEAP